MYLAVGSIGKENQEFGAFVPAPPGNWTHLQNGAGAQEKEALVVFAACLDTAHTERSSTPPNFKPAEPTQRLVDEVRDARFIRFSFPVPYAG